MSETVRVFLHKGDRNLCLADTKCFLTRANSVARDVFCLQYNTTESRVTGEELTV